MSTDKNHLLDKNGIEIQVGDVLKVFHYVAAVRRQKCYMYKQVLERVMLNKNNPVPAYKMSHLDLQPKSYYWELIDGRKMDHYEIIQGCDQDFKKRPRRAS